MKEVKEEAKPVEKKDAPVKEKKEKDSEGPCGLPSKCSIV